MFVSVYLNLVYAHKDCRQYSALITLQGSISFTTVADRFVKIAREARTFKLDLEISPPPLIILGPSSCDILKTHPNGDQLIAGRRSIRH